MDIDPDTVEHTGLWRWQAVELAPAVVALLWMAGASFEVKFERMWRYAMRSIAAGLAPAMEDVTAQRRLLVLELCDAVVFVQQIEPAWPTNAYGETDPGFL